MVRAGKGKAGSIEFQLRQKKMTEVQKEVLADYDGRLWALCYPEKADNTASRCTLGMAFMGDAKWTKVYPFSFTSTRYSKSKKDSVIEVIIFHYSMFFKNA